MTNRWGALLIGGDCNTHASPFLILVALSLLSGATFHMIKKSKVKGFFVEETNQWLSIAMMNLSLQGKMAYPDWWFANLVAFFRCAESIRCLKNSASHSSQLDRENSTRFLGDHAT